ncbi:hypothetical protein PoB_006467700 [Plakobranchus ocellatus]|uniref:Uncharacterized protein n=1 Tax=Plakobranchus ocellatus TaxID=259542 RepID=A0AAV4D1Y0_9GAST|nr:hypothetical protein PoB_006467700 [Plakobranchus ocellatus]
MCKTFYSHLLEFSGCKGEFFSYSLVFLRGKEVIIAVFWLFLCVSVINVNSCIIIPKKDCRIDDRLYYHGRSFFLPGCKFYKCDDGQVVLLKAECFLKGFCFQVGRTMPMSGRLYKCVKKQGKLVEVEEMNKDCEYHGESYGSTMTFYYPPHTCQLHLCNDGKVQHLKPECSYRGLCLKLGFVLRLSNGTYKCVRKPGNRAEFEEIINTAGSGK